MGCCPGRHRLRSSEEDRLLDGDVRLKVRNLAGEELQLTFPSTAPARELQEAVHREWKIPLLAQRFVLNDEVVRLEGALGRVLRMPQGGDLEVAFLRSQLPEEIQESLDRRLLNAVAAGDYKDISEVLAEGATSSQDSKVPTPLSVAVALKDTKAQEMLLAAGFREDIAEKQMAFGSLRRAFASQSLSGAVWCLAQGADVNTWLRRGDGVRDTSGGTPLHACCAQFSQPGASAVVTLLCRLRADVNAGDSEGDSPLAHARYFGAKEIESVLRRYGAKLKGPYYQFSFRR